MTSVSNYQVKTSLEHNSMSKVWLDYFLQSRTVWHCFIQWLCIPIPSWFYL